MFQMQDSIDGIDFIAEGLRKKPVKVTSENDFLFIGELAEKFGLSPRTIRFYERAGLLDPVRHGKFRTYMKDDAERLSFILKMRRLGISIADIKALFNNTEQKKEVARNVLQQHVEDLKKQRVLIERQLAESVTVLQQLNESEPQLELVDNN